MFTSRRHGRGAVTATTALAAAALVAGLTSTASFADTSGPGGGAVTAGTDSAAPGHHWVTLITGDRVAVDARGKVVSIDRAQGRERIPVRSFTREGRAFVIPLDAERLIARGTLDRRLFDITGLNSPASRHAYRKGLKVIVAYEGTGGPAARAGARSDTEVRRTLPALNADALTVPERDAGALWESLTRPDGEADGARTARTGVATVWLDAVRTASLDRSVARTGAPTAWRAGYTGKGVTIAVLDTGVDATHPDLKGQVTGAKNFSDSPDTKDRNGHGTHVASTAAGTGARSGGQHKGVAPGARVLNAKVLDDEGNGEDSGILAGMDWAVARGAQVINMSLGHRDEPGLDPVEAHLNTLSQKKGVLFAVAAGNSGSDSGTVNSPGTAEAALTVGAVNDTGGMAGFSSRGPRVDGGFKPDVTAPGVAITAASAPGSAIAREQGERPAGYVSVSGTSMAAPHAAGAAALLKQRHPSWSGARIKAALMASAKDGGHGVFEQGAGEIAADRALRQTVTADQSGLSFGFHAWPHTDDKPVTKKITYRNHGKRAITLDLAVRAVDARGKPASAKLFTLGTGRVTVPAGGSASVPVTADTRFGGAHDGTYTATVTATGGGQSLRTVALVDREVESYALTVKYVGRDGKPSGDFSSLVEQISGDGRGSAGDAQGKTSATFRLPKGDYALSGNRYAGPQGGMDHLIQPRLALTENTTVTLDARRAKPVSITVPDAKAKLTGAKMTYDVSKAGRYLNGEFDVDRFGDLRTAQLGPARPSGVTIRQTFHGQWERGATQYNAAVGGPVKRLATGVDKSFTAADFAKLPVTVAASRPGKSAYTIMESGLDGSSFTPRSTFALPGTRTHYVATDTGAKSNPWAPHAFQLSAEGEHEVQFNGEAREYAPGRTHAVPVGTAVHSPSTPADSGAYRYGDSLQFGIPLFSDGASHAGQSPHTSARTTLHQGTTRIREDQLPPGAGESFTVDPENAEYTLATSVRRSPAISRVSTRVDASWTFRSARPAGDEQTLTQLSTVRFGTSVALDGTVPAGRTATFPVTVQGPAAGKNLKSLTVSISYDGGTTWTKLPVTDGKVTAQHPAKGTSVALRGQATDTKGGKASVTVYDAYFGK
ncbi:S8 family serine peptidase [Streptomyces sp. NPDC057638]|uniref:S8 family peptidase n=1 Tax=Streptomyces sp. NPDC057638 TaxID=3346190 RepID=UPI0036ADF895